MNPPLQDFERTYATYKKNVEAILIKQPDSEARMKVCPPPSGFWLLLPVSRSRDAEGGRDRGLACRFP